MAVALLSTKLSPPQSRDDRVSRPQLTRRLHEGLQPGHKLILVSAPAGYGKTTLLTGWLTEVACPYAWLSLDAADSDPARFLAYLLAALRQINPRIGRAAEGLFQAPQPPPAEALLVGLINELALVPADFILVLDDYHLIQSMPVHQMWSPCAGALKGGSLVCNWRPFRCKAGWMFRRRFTRSPAVSVTSSIT